VTGKAPHTKKLEGFQNCLCQVQSGQTPVFAVPPNSPSISECRRVSVLVHSSVSEVGKCQQPFVERVVVPKDQAVVYEGVRGRGAPDTAVAEDYTPYADVAAVVRSGVGLLEVVAVRHTIVHGRIVHDLLRCCRLHSKWTMELIGRIAHRRKTCITHP